jgi:hypothetical protein
MNFLFISAIVVLVMLVIGCAEVKREPRWNEKDERVQHKKAA